MASWMHLMIMSVLLLACCSRADECEQKDMKLREYYEGTSDCNKVETILSKTTACSDSDKKYLAVCLKEKEDDWTYILDNCQEDSMGEPTDPTGEPDASAGPAEAPSDEEAVGMLNDVVEGRRLLAASKDSLPCLELFQEYGWDEFKSSALMSHFSGVLMGLLGAASMLTMLIV